MLVAHLGTDTTFPYIALKYGIATTGTLSVHCVHAFVFTTEYCMLTKPSILAILQQNALGIAAVIHHASPLLAASRLAIVSWQHPAS